MAQIRLVDDWLRSPASPPSHYRSVMVIAEKWAEQRVLMRAYAESRDQTRPTILMHGQELAIGPAGTDIHGPWGIHVGEGPDGPDGRAQEIKHHLEHAARRIAGSKGNPPRLMDEGATFDREPTGNWAPGAPRVVPHRADFRQTPVDFVTPVTAARVPQTHAATFVPQVSAAQVVPSSQAVLEMSAPSNPDARLTPVRAKGRTHPPPMRTALGYASGSGAQSAIVRLGLAPHVSVLLGRLVDRVVPTDFHIDAGERRVLNALGAEDRLTARAIGQMLDVVDAVAFMEELVRKLESFGLGDLVEPSEPERDEPTYRLRR
jgi:hypothetical protein